MARTTISYELPQGDIAPVVMTSFDSDVPDEICFGPDALRYDTESGYWEFKTHRHPSKQSNPSKPARSETTYRIRVPRHRVYRVSREDPYEDWEETDHNDPLPTKNDVQRLVYENEDPDADTPRVVDTTRDELLEPIRYEEDSSHWRYSTHDTTFTEEGHTFVYSRWIPRERVYYALEETGRE